MTYCLLCERAHVVHHVPTLCFSLHPSLTCRHDPLDTFRNLPEDFAIRHCRHAFFVREIGRFAAKSRKARFVAGAGFSVTKDAVALFLVEVESFSSLDRLSRCRGRILCLVCILGEFPGVLRKILLLAAGSGTDRAAVVLIPIGSS